MPKISLFHPTILNAYICAKKETNRLPSFRTYHVRTACPLSPTLFIGLFAGHDQCGGDTVVKDGQKYKLFYGMASDTAMKRHEGSVAEYRASEGKTITLPCRQVYAF